MWPFIFVDLYKMWNNSVHDENNFIWFWVFFLFYYYAYGLILGCKIVCIKILWVTFFQPIFPPSNSRHPSFWFVRANLGRICQKKRQVNGHVTFCRHLNVCCPATQFAIILHACSWIRLSEPFSSFGNLNRDYLQMPFVPVLCKLHLLCLTLNFISYEDCSVLMCRNCRLLIKSQMFMC